LNDPRVLASPRVRKYARDQGLDLNLLKGSGPGGRIELIDLRPASLAKKAPFIANTSSASGATDARDAFGPVRREKLSMIEQATARHMARCWATIPHVTLFRDIEVTRFEAQRQAAKKSFEKIGVKITLTSIFVKLVAAALRRHPRVNSSFSDDEGQIIYKDYIHVGVAVDTARGLLVPVIADADRKSLASVAGELTQLSEAAHAGNLRSEHMRGGTFTITNLGGLGVGYFTPIVNHPEVAILGLGAIRPILGTAALMAPLSLSFDHRVLNGADAARFLDTLADSVADPLVTLLG